MPAGRPPIIETPEELETKIDEYFISIVGGDLHKSDRADFKPIPPTITGLCLFLGFADRQSFRDYGDKEQFTCTIKNAHTRIEQKYEENLNSNNVAGSIFALKNLGWKDKTESVVTLHTEQPIFPPLKDE